MALVATIDAAIAYLTLDHPEKGNSFGIQEAERLSEVLRDKKLKGLVLTGRGSRFFCTGGNLAEQARAKIPKASLSAQKKIREALGRLAEWHGPTVSLINGDCFGGGTELLSAFDHVLAAPHVFFGFWQRKLGLTYGWGGGQRLEARLGGRLKTRALGTKVFGANEAFEIGLIDGIAPCAQLEARGREWIDRALSYPSYSQFKSWEPKNETKIFDKLWMNPAHKAIVGKHSG